MSICRSDSSSNKMRVCMLILHTMAAAVSLSPFHLLKTSGDPEEVIGRCDRVLYV